MKSNNDFTKWLDDQEFDGKEIYFLYSAVNEVTSYGLFSCSNIKEDLLKVETSETGVPPLFISSDKQKKYFLDYIENNYCNGDVELFYTLQNDSEKE